jgi:hypothetical protein
MRESLEFDEHSDEEEEFYSDDLVSKCESESEESDNDGRECKQEKMIRSL